MQAWPTRRALSTRPRQGHDAMTARRRCPLTPDSEGAKIALRNDHGVASQPPTPTDMPERRATVSIREVGLRDGLQILARTMPTDRKLEWLRGSYDAGLREIE